MYVCAFTYTIHEVECYSQNFFGSVCHMWLKTDMSVFCLYVTIVWLVLRHCIALNGRLGTE
jgi:hypothetical protein